MKKKIILKIIAVSILSIFVFFGSIFLLMISVPSSYGATIGVLMGFVLLCLIYACGVPIWFEDYIKDFWKKEEEKKCQEKGVEEKNI